MKNFISLFIALFISFGLFSQTDVLPPALVSPTDGDDDQVLDVAMDWNAVAGIGTITYELQYDTSSTFANPVSIETEYTSAKGEYLYFGTTYYWRVRAMDDGGTSEWSEVFTYITFAQIILNKPGDEDDDITPEFDLEWKIKYGGSSLTGIEYYDYEVAYDTNFTEIFIAASKAYVEMPETYLKQTISLMLFDTTYYWRVRARHTADESIWSETWMFETMSQCVNELPEDGATGQMLDVTVQWDDVRGSYEYIYELCDDPDFNTPCIFFTDENSVTAMGLLFDKTYYWRVKAAHTQDTSAWSDTWSFETLNTVILESPENGGYVNDIFPLLTWSEVTGITGFQLMYDKDQNFSDPYTAMIDGDKTSYKVIYSLEMDATYYWKMRAYENGDTTNWSDVWSFTIGEAPQGINDLLSDKTVNIYPNPAISNLNIEVNSLKPGTVEVSILNLLGQAVARQEFDLIQGKNKNQINVKGLENGLYIIRLKSDDATFMKKIVIEK